LELILNWKRPGGESVKPEEEEEEEKLIENVSLITEK
jgi:hypothetical protein